MKTRRVEQARQSAGMITRRDLQQLQEVNDLVVAPVPDVGPGIVRIEHLPVEAVAHDAVRIVAVGGGGVDELEDHALDVTGERQRQRFPVLEDVAPVALIVEYPLAVRRPSPRWRRCSRDGSDRRGGG